MNKLTLLIIAIAVLTTNGCQQIEKSIADDLLEVDREFSAYSEQNGLKSAFIEYVHPEGILLRQNRYPIVGKEEVITYLEPVSDANFQLTWEPLSGRIAASGEMGFTYGIYTMKQDTMIRKGTYVSIWEKDKEGNWKYILDTGNEGLGEN